MHVSPRFTLHHPSLPSPKKKILGEGAENRKVISCYKYLEVIVLLVRVVRGCKKIQRHRGELNWEERITIKSPFKRFATKKKKNKKKKKQ